jgi:formate hydrogenlyase subunit 3/multisubunit Na+/H+ antiporter MnhD subunit
VNAAVAPVVVPLLAGLLCVVLQPRRLRWAVSVGAGVASVAASVWLVALSHVHGVVTLRFGAGPRPTASCLPQISWAPS